MTDASDAIDASITPVDAPYDASSEVFDADASNAEDAAEALTALFDNGLTLLEGIGNIIHANLNDCDAMGDRLEEYREAHTTAVARVKALYDPGRSGERRALQSHYRGRFKSAWANVRPGIIKCKETPKVKRIIHIVWGDDMDASAPP